MRNSDISLPRSGMISYKLKFHIKGNATKTRQIIKKNSFTGLNKNIDIFKILIISLDHRWLQIFDKFGHDMKMLRAHRTC